MLTFKEVTKGNPNMIVFPKSAEENMGYFTKERVARSTLPDGWNLYEFRTGTSGTKSTLEPVVMVNFGGSFVTETQIDFPNENDKYRNIKGKVKKL